MTRNLVHLLIVFSFVLFATLIAQAETTGTLMVVKGDVTIIDGQTKESKPAKLGMKVRQGDTIVAGKDSRAKIVMADQNTINISPDSKVSLDKYVYDPAKDKKDVMLNVLYGKIRSSVEQKYDGEKNKFTVKTPTAVAGVRGTDFLTGFNRQTNTSQIVTFRGQVAFGMPGPNGAIVNPVLVNAGQATSAAAGRPPQPPKAMSQASLAALNNETKADSPTQKEQNGPAAEPKKDDNGKDDNGKKDEPATESQKDDQKADSKNDDSQKESKKDEAKTDSQKDDTKSESKKDTAKAEAKTNGNREPASTSNGQSMLDTNADTGPEVISSQGPIYQNAPSPEMPAIPQALPTPVPAPTPPIPVGYIGNSNINLNICRKGTASCP